MSSDEATRVLLTFPRRPELPPHLKTVIPTVVKCYEHPLGMPSYYWTRDPATAQWHRNAGPWKYFMAEALPPGQAHPWMQARRDKHFWPDEDGHMRIGDPPTLPGQPNDMTESIKAILPAITVEHLRLTNWLVEAGRHNQFSALGFVLANVPRLNDKDLGPLHIPEFFIAQTYPCFQTDDTWIPPAKCRRALLDTRIAQLDCLRAGLSAIVGAERVDILHRFLMLERQRLDA